MPRPAPLTVSTVTIRGVEWYRCSTTSGRCSALVRPHGPPMDQGNVITWDGTAWVEMAYPEGAAWYCTSDGIQVGPDAKPYGAEYCRHVSAAIASLQDS